MFENIFESWVLVFVLALIIIIIGGCLFVSFLKQKASHRLYDNIGSLSLIAFCAGITTLFVFSGIKEHYLSEEVAYTVRQVAAGGIILFMSVVLVTLMLSYNLDKTIKRVDTEDDTPLIWSLLALAAPAFAITFVILICVGLYEWYFANKPFTIVWFGLWCFVLSTLIGIYSIRK